MSLPSLPLDILFNIFNLFDNLQDLHAVTSVTKPLHQAFCDHRARILQHVFRNKILNLHAHYFAKPDPVFYEPPFRRPITPICSPTPGLVLEVIDPIMARYEKTDLPDRLILRSTAWATFIGFNSPEWVFTSLGRKLISLCQAIGREDLALSYTVELWGYISTRQTFEYSITDNKSASDRYANSFARNLAKKYYRDLNRPEDAARTILQCYEMRMREHDYQLFSSILQYTQDMDDPSEVLSYFRERTVTERETLIDSGLFKGDIHWIFCYTLLLSNLGKVQDAIRVFNNTYMLYPDDKLDPATIEGLARRMTKSLMKQGYHDEAFVIYQQILTLLSHMHLNTPSKYIAWAKQYIAELYNVGLSVDALAVEEQCWHRVLERLRERKELSLIRPASGVAWALYDSYRTRGRLPEGLRVKREYESLAEAYQEPGSHIYWPGTSMKGWLS